MTVYQLAYIYQVEAASADDARLLSEAGFARLIDIWIAVQKPPETSPSDDLLAAAKALRQAYLRGAENGGGIDWEDLDIAHELAGKALEKIGVTV